MKSFYLWYYEFNYFLHLIAAIVQENNQLNSEGNNHFKSGVVSFNLTIVREHPNYDELHETIKHKLPGRYVGNGTHFQHSPENSFSAEQDKSKDRIEVSPIGSGHYYNSV